MPTTRLLFVNHTAQLGGGEVALANLIAHLDRDRYEPLLLLFCDGPLRERIERAAPVVIVPLSKRVLNTHKETMGFGALTQLRGIVSSSIFVLRLSIAIRKLNVDIVHTNSLKADILGGCAAKLAGVPIVWHVRDRIAPDYLPRIAVRGFRALSRVLPDRLITNSRATLSTLLSEQSPDSGVAMDTEQSFRSKCYVVHDGVPARDLRSPLPERKGVVVGIVGRISPWKGQDIFLRAAALVRERYPETTFLIVGSALFGEDTCEKRLRELCRRLGLETSVHFTGFVEDVNAVIDKLDILVHASTLPEPFGQVIIEGMVAGKPVIAADGGGVPEIVRHEITGLLVPMKDIAAMAEAIVRLIESPATRREMGANGRNLVEEHFSMRKTIQGVESIYDSILLHRSDRQPSFSRHDPGEALADGLCTTHSHLVETSFELREVAAARHAEELN
jgi:glycosyltransferase involved in cell wall biosynthesis